jgi:hypothetical protein
MIVIDVATLWPLFLLLRFLWHCLEPESRP